MIANLNNSFALGRQIVFIDEVIFTYQTNQKLEYSNRYENIFIKDKNVQTYCIAVVAAISINKGLEEFYSYEKSINQEKFIDFLLGLHDKTRGRQISLLLDNLRVHHCQKVKQLCNQLNIEMIFTPPYSPEINPIENFFSLVKNKYKRIKTNIAASGLKVNSFELVRKSFQSIENDIIKKMCLKKMNKLGLNVQ